VFQKHGKEFVLDALHVIIGSFLYTAGVFCFTAPNQIAPGGVSGLSTMINALTHIPMGVLTFVLNVPLLLLAFFFVGKRFACKTLITISVMTFFLDIVLIHLPVYQGDMILGAVFGGGLMGTGLGIVFMRDFTTGGSDIIAKLVQVKRPDFQMGQLIMMVDVCIVAISGFVYGKIESVLYAGITIFVYTKVADTVLYRKGSGKVVFLISRKGQEIARRIILECHRGVTILNGRGAYSGMPNNVLVIALRSRDYFKLKTIASEVDERAFIIASDCGEIHGNGFRPGDLPEVAAADWNGGATISENR
jgi:uncharacterized membrane-anchored protein YitT (DUF2179 family)